MKFKNTNFYNGYKGFDGTKLDQTESELYDDIPAATTKELILQVMAGGQIQEERRRAMFYDTDEDVDPDDIEEIDAGTSAESFDYVQAYKEHMEHKREMYFKAQQQIKKAEPEPEKKEPKEEPKQEAEA